MNKIIKDFVFQQYNIILLSAKSGSCFADQSWIGITRESRRGLKFHMITEGVYRWQLRWI
jgi:hypothetical protein